MSSKTLFAQFVEAHLGLETGSYVGLQQSFGSGSDLLLFNWGRATLAVPITVLEESRQIAQQTVRERIETARRAWREAS